MTGIFRLDPVPWPTRRGRPGAVSHQHHTVRYRHFAGLTHLGVPGSIARQLAALPPVASLFAAVLASLLRGGRLPEPPSSAARLETIEVARGRDGGHVPHHRSV